MILKPLFPGLLIVVLVTPAIAEVYPVIIHGKVTMADGTPPPKSVSIQRVCSDSQGSAPGPITDKKGEYIWRMDVDPMRTRACRLEASLTGYVSTGVDISTLNGYTDPSQTVATIILSSRIADPYTIVSTEGMAPSKAAGPWKAAMKAVDAGNLPEATSQLQAAVKAVPKFAQAWHTLGIVYQTQAMFNEAKDAFQHAIEADPKLVTAYVGLLRMDIKTKDWQGALTASEALLKADSKKSYPEVYLHQATAHYGLKDYDAALASVKESIRLDTQRKRNQYVLSRILEAKGDIPGARDAMNEYLAMDPNVADVEVLKTHVQYLGKPEAATVDPDLEP